MIIEYKEKSKFLYEVAISQSDVFDWPITCNWDIYESILGEFGAISGYGSTKEEAIEDFLKKCGEISKSTDHILNQIYQQISVDRNLEKEGLK